MKTPENLWFCGVFKGYKMGPLARNGLKINPFTFMHIRGSGFFFAWIKRMDNETFIFSKFLIISNTQTGCFFFSNLVFIKLTQSRFVFSEKVIRGFSRKRKQSFEFAQCRVTPTLISGVFIFQTLYLIFT